MTTRVEKRREIRKHSDSLVEQLEKARDSIEETLEKFESGDIEDGLAAFEQADAYVSRARRRTMRVSDAFDSLNESESEDDWRRR